MELWRSIEGFDLYYEVSSTGSVRSLKRKESKVLKSITTRTCGYPTVSLCSGVPHRVHQRTIHRLVARAFLPNPDNLPFVNHIDGNKSNNLLHNLEWCTPAQNMTHSFVTGLNRLDGTIGSKNGRSKISEETALSIYESKRRTTDIAVEFGVSCPTVCDIKRGRSWSHITGACKVRQTKYKNRPSGLAYLISQSG